MYAAVRRQQILDVLEERGAVSVDDLAARFDISKTAVRRDLNELAKAGLLERTYGGAVKIPNLVEETPYAKRKVLHANEKRRIGEAAARLVEAGDTVFVDCGTTTELLTDFLIEKESLTLVTPCLKILNRLTECDHITVVAVGGVLNHQHRTMGGVLGDGFLRSQDMRFDKAFISAGGISAEQGIISARLEELPVKKRAIELATEAILVADGSKVGRHGVGVLGPATLIKRLITDTNAPSDEIETLRQLGIRVDLA